MDDRSRRAEALLRTPMLIAAALTLPAVAISESHPGGWLETVAVTLNWGIWIAFAAEALIMLAVVPDRRGWLRSHPLEVAIVILTPPVLPASLQSIRAVRLLRLIRLLRLAKISREVFSLQGLGYAAFLAVLTVVAGGAVFVAFERGRGLDTWDGVYWAITTMTTLGSQISPTTTGAEVVAVVVLVVGIGFVAMLTGAVAQRFLGPAISETEAELAAGADSPEAMAVRQLGELKEQIQALEVSVSRLAEDRGPGPPG